MTYRLGGWDLVLDWIAGNKDPGDTEALLAWLPKLADDPLSQVLTTLPGHEEPVYVGRVEGSHVHVTFVVVDEPDPVVIIVHLEPSWPGFGSSV